MFFYNPSTKTSVWERPSELRDRADVDRMVSSQPKDDKVDQSNDKTTDTKNEPETEELENGKRDNVDDGSTKTEDGHVDKKV